MVCCRYLLIVICFMFINNVDASELTHALSDEEISLLVSKIKTPLNKELNEVTSQGNVVELQRLIRMIVPIDEYTANDTRFTVHVYEPSFHSIKGDFSSIPIAEILILAPGRNALEKQFASDEIVGCFVFKNYSDGNRFLVTMGCYSDDSIIKHIRYSCSALSKAAKNGNDQLIKYLIGIGMNPNYLTGYYFPLFKAFLNNHQRAACMLVSTGADISILSELIREGSQALKESLNRLNNSFLMYRDEHKLVYRKEHKLGGTKLLYDITYQNAVNEYADELIRLNKYIRKTSSTCIPQLLMYVRALFNAAERKDLKTVQILFHLEPNIPMDLCNDRGETLLHIAMHHGDKKTLKYLLSLSTKEADLKTFEGLTFIDYAFLSSGGIESMLHLCIEAAS